MKLKCIVVDDEKLAQNVLQKFISMIPTLELVNKCSNALEAITYLHEHEVDLIFLDINMPEVTGLEMLKTIENPPKVIITTAYSEYALESYEFSVVDYLLKPIPFDRFLKAVNKVIAQKYLTTEKIKQDNEEHFPESIMIKQDYISYNVKLEQIIYIEAFGNYLNIYTTDKKYITREKLHVFEEKLPSSMFVQVHKSYIIAIKKLTSIEGNILKIGNNQIPIGSYYKSRLIEKLKG